MGEKQAGRVIKQSCSSAKKTKGGGSCAYCHIRRQQVIPYRPNFPFYTRICAQHFGKITSKKIDSFNSLRYIPIKQWLALIRKQRNEGNRWIF